MNTDEWRTTSTEILSGLRDILFVPSFYFRSVFHPWLDFVFFPFSIRGSCRLLLAVAGPDGQADVADAGRVAGREDVGQVLVIQLGIAPDDDPLVLEGLAGLAQDV